METKNTRLTQFSKGAGCGCKIAPDTLQEILKNIPAQANFKNLLVGFGTNDDAAVYEIDNGKAIISTSDFFMPIVDDPFDFGRIAACNALSDVYAMGGKPLMAIAILGWPVGKLPLDVCGDVIKGAQSICAEAGIPLAGGHSIDSLEPIFGLAVTGIVDSDKIKKNNNARAGDLLYLTKSLGTGILSTALKKGVLKEEDYPQLINSMCTLNKFGSVLAGLNYVNALTDVTGFSIIGHLHEMVKSAGLSAELYYGKLPKMTGINDYINQNIFPGNTTRNFNAYKNDVSGLDGLEFLLLCDPQTSGGLLISVDAAHQNEFEKLLRENKFEEKYCSPVGRFVAKEEKLIKVIV